MNTQHCRRKVAFLGIVTVIASFAGRSSPAQQITSGARQVMTVPILERVVISLSDFLLDDVNGITSIWKLVGTLAPH